MRPNSLALLALLLAAAAAPCVAEDPPSGATPAETGASPEEPPIGDLGPKEALARIQTEARNAPPAERRGILESGVRAYVEGFTQAGRTAVGEDLLTLGHMQRMLDRPAEAAKAYQAVAAEAACSADVRDQAALAEAGLLAHSAYLKQLGAEGAAAARERLGACADAMAEPERRSARGRLRAALAEAHDEADAHTAALALRVQAALDDPALAPRMARGVSANLMARGHALESYEPMREAARAAFDTLRAQQQQEVTAAKASGDERRIAVAEAGRKQLEQAMQPFEMLGRPAPEWTAEKAPDGLPSLASLRGKVVVLDFWATWCPWCIKSFPALREVQRDYGPRGFVLVGVTASASAVYEERFDLDDDLKDRARGGRPTPVARLASERAPADGVSVFPEAEYRARELEALGRFVANHEMDWPVVMIDKAEPDAKFALRGWPHAVVIDRAGRVRAFKSGALLKDRPEDVAHFRRLLEDLLSESAE